MNHLIDRLYSAIENSESVILDQIRNDIYSVINGKEIDTDEYRIVADGKDILIHDKVHDENTKVSTSDEGLRLEDVPIKSLKSYSDSILLDSENNVIAVGPEYKFKELLKSNPTWKLSNLYEMPTSKQKLFTSRLRKYAVLDDQGRFKVIVDKNTALELVKTHKDWVMIREREYWQLNQNKLRKFSMNK